MSAGKGIGVVIENIESKIRIIDRKLDKCELREKQIIIMFKMIMDKHYNSKRSKSIKMIDIVNYMEQLINKNLPPDELRESSDLLSEVIKKGLK